MRIALNMANLRGQGSRQVGQGIHTGLLAAGVDIAHCWIPEVWPDLPDFRGNVSRVRSGLLPKLLADNVSVRAHLRRLDAACLFSLGDTGTIAPPVPHLLLVQQAFLAYTSEDLDFPLTAAFRAKLTLMSKYFQAGLPGVTHFTVQTEDMKRRLAARWGLSSDRVSVVPSAVDDIVLEFAQRGRAPAPEPYLCYLASANSHKNHEILAPVLARVRRHSPRVTCHLTVRPEEVPALSAAARRLGVFEAFVFHGALSRRASMELLAGARAAIIPSKLESFGIPYYEAMALGVPVIAADRPFAREACGDAALYAGADDAASFADRLAELFESDDVPRQCPARRFADVHVPWDAIGDRYLSIIRHAARGIC